jgi:hypothetical protein
MRAQGHMSAAVPLQQRIRALLCSPTPTTTTNPGDVTPHQLSLRRTLTAPPLAGWCAPFQAKAASHTRPPMPAAYRYSASNRPLLAVPSLLPLGQDESGSP